MPKITALPFDYTALSISVERDAKRSKGVHLSGIIRDLMITAGIGYQVKGKPFTKDELHMVFQTGFLWERMVEEYIHTDYNKAIEWEYFVKPHLNQLLEDDIAKSNGDIVRPGECSLDGIAMTPDAINIRSSFVEEWKATSIRSTNMDIETRKPEWLWQAAAYAKVFGYTTAVFRIWHFAQVPGVVNQLVVEFTQQEVDDNWKRIVDHWHFMQTRQKK